MSGLKAGEFLMYKDFYGLWKAARYVRAVTQHVVSGHGGTQEVIGDYRLPSTTADALQIEDLRRNEQQRATAEIDELGWRISALELQREAFGLEVKQVR